MTATEKLPVRPAERPDDALAFSILACPSCGGDLRPAGDGITCVACHSQYQRDGVLRFVDREAYTESFGLQWRTFSRVQLDSGRLADSERRLRAETGLHPADLEGKIVLEALACGCPVIAFDCPRGVREIVQTGRNGVLLPPEDVAGLRDTLVRLLRAPAERVTLRGQIAASLAPFAVTTVVHGWDALLDDVTMHAGA